MSPGRSALLVAGMCVACASDGASPEPRIPASIAFVASPSGSTTVGTTAGTLSVLVVDRNDRPLSGVVTTFSVTAGGSRVSPVVDTTDASGLASTVVTLGTIPGTSQISALVAGLAPIRFNIAASVGSTHSLTLNPRFIRIPQDGDGLTVAATTRDAAGNITSEPIVWIARDPTLVSVSSGQGAVGVINVARRPGETWVVALDGSGIDSVRVAVQDAASSPCDFVTPPRNLAVGEAGLVDGALMCVRATEPGAEYAVVAHYNTALTHVAARVFVTGFGVTPPSGPFALRASSPDASVMEPDNDFETALRGSEAQRLPSFVPGARDWHSRRQRMLNASSGAAGIPATARVGDVLGLNVNARDFCDNPSIIRARVVAITNGTIILADTANPAGGFTAEEFQAFGTTMDTLVRPVNETAFGAPSDIDANDRVVILFTKAVNQMTQRGAAGVILGFYYVRDLLPRESASGSCPGSNVGEMFYLLTPDPEAVFSDARAKADVQRTTLATIAHEYQHLINASRRMYVTEATQVNEEVWLNEGLSHIAEELVFYRASGRAPRQNIDGSQLALGTTTRELFDQYLLGNFRRYRQYVLTPEATSPFAGDAQLTTRGASWSFLRYLADRRGATDGDLWHRLVNSNLVGTPNLDAALAGSGLTATSTLADWSVALLTDDGAAATTASFQQSSWNYPSVMPSTGISVNYPLQTRQLADAMAANVVLQAGGNAYLRFGVPQGRDALLQVTATGNAIPPGIRLILVRTR